MTDNTRQTETKKLVRLLKLIWWIGLLLSIIVGFEIRVQSVRKELQHAKQELATLRSSCPTQNSLDEVAPSKTMENLKEFIQYRNYRVFDGLADQIVLGTLKASQDFSIPVTVLVGLMDIESDFRYDVVSSADAVGLTQVHIPTWGSSTKSNKYNLVDAGIIKKAADLYDPQTNIYAGAYILHHYMEQAKTKGESDILKYAMTRYLGGEKNAHYQNLVRAIGEYQVFTYRNHVVSMTLTESTHTAVAN